MLAAFSSDLMDTTHYIKVQFERGFNGTDKGPFLLAVERLARAMLEKPAEVFMETMRDQNKLRRKLGKDDVI